MKPRRLHSDTIFSISGGSLVWLIKGTGKVSGHRSSLERKVTVQPLVKEGPANHTKDKVEEASRLFPSTEKGLIIRAIRMI